MSATDGKPAGEFDNQPGADLVRPFAEGEPIMRFFAYEHLPPRLALVSKPFAELAEALITPDRNAYVPRSAERTVALRKLLEAKDAAVRAAL